MRLLSLRKDSLTELLIARLEFSMLLKNDSGCSIYKEEEYIISCLCKLAYVPPEPAIYSFSDIFLLDNMCNK